MSSITPKILTSLLLIAGTSSLPAYAQTDNGAAQAQAERLLHEQQQRRQQEEQTRDAKRQQQKPVLPEMQPKTAQTPSSETTQCSQINHIQLTGITLLTAEIQQTLIHPYLQRCLTLNDINQLLAAITNAYFDRGYITSRAYIPAQNLKTGRLELIIIEGKIQSLQSEQLKPRTLAQSFPTKTGKPLNLRDLEQGIEQLNRLTSQQTNLELLPGDQPGQTRINIHTRATSPWRITSSLDNSGQENSGEQQLGINTAIDNSLGLADYLTLDIQGNTDSGETSHIRSSALHYDLPIGYWNLDLDLNRYTYNSQVKGAQITFNTSGENQTQSLRLSRLWYRNQHSKFGQRLSLRRKKNLNYIEDTLLQTSSQTLVSVSTEAWYQYNLDQGYWLATLGYDQGVSGLGATDDSQKTAAEPRAQYHKWRLNLNYGTLLTLGQQNLRYNASLNGQTSQDILYSAEQISIGSQYTVRGYKQQGASGNQGAWLRQELSLGLPATPASWQKYTGNWQLTLGLDAGKVSDSQPPQTPWTHLYGWGLRLSNSGAPYTLAIEIARAFNVPDNIQTDKHNLYISLHWTFQPKTSN